MGNLNFGIVNQVVPIFDELNPYFGAKLTLFMVKLSYLMMSAHLMAESPFFMPELNQWMVPQ